MNKLIERVGLNQLHTITINGINDSATQTIHNIIRDALGNIYRPFGLDWDVIEMSKAKKGKAISSHLFKEWGISLDDETKSKIGTVASEGEDNFTYHFEIIKLEDGVWWEDGDFGDGGSCYWGNNSGARDMLVDNGAYAVRTYGNRDDYNSSYRSGNGRAWLWPLGDDKLIIWNGYMNSGDHYGRETRHFAGMLAEFLGVPHKRINLRNNRDTCGTLYINSGKGFVIGETPEDFKSYDFAWTDIEQYVCERCGDSVYEPIFFHSDAYCEYCYNESFVTCDRCEEMTWSDESYYVESNNTNVCWGCYNYHHEECAECSEMFEEDDLYENPDNRNQHVCRDCRNEIQTRIEEEEAMRQEEEEVEHV